MSKHLVIGNIKRDGKLLPRNKPAEFDDADAERLVRDGYLAPAGKAQAAQESGGDGETDEQRQASEAAVAEQAKAKKSASKAAKKTKGA